MPIIGQGQLTTHLMARSLIATLPNAGFVNLGRVPCKGGTRHVKIDRTHLRRTIREPDGRFKAIWKGGGEGCIIFNFARRVMISQHKEVTVGTRQSVISS